MAIHHKRKTRVTYEGPEAEKVAVLVSQQLLALPTLPDLPALPGLTEVPQLASPNLQLIAHNNGGLKT